MVTAIPGASAVLAALAVASLPTDRFFFEGFLPPKQIARQKRIAALANIPATLVLFETGARLGAMLADAAQALGPRAAAVCRELTKLHEEIKTSDLSALARDYAGGAETRGEFVVVVAPAGDDGEEAADVDDLLRRALARASVKDAVAEVATVTGRPRREIYQRALALGKGSADD
jgi:16S rRNA (cytidine1402-2'-O)-methyltransferase